VATCEYHVLSEAADFRVATPMWEHVDMPATEETVAALRKAVRAKKTAEDRATAARNALAVAMTDAIHAGVKQGEVVTITGLTREHVRRLVREVEEQRASQS
jgi:ABC-type branched-subunit amino acid transport system substrate-binding protein